MTTFWRRQSQSAGNYPPAPALQSGIPNFPQTLPPSTVVGRLSNGAGPTEAIPFAVFLAAVLANLQVQIETAAGAIVVAATTQVLILNKTIASVTPITLPSVFARNKVELQIYDWTGLSGDMTLTPFGTEKIMGSTNPWVIGSGGVAQSGGSLRLLPLTDLPGWLVR